MKHLTGFQVFQGVLIAAVVGAVVTGFIIVGPPSQERARRFDQQRLNDLSQIQYGVQSYFETHKKLPETLQALQTENFVFSPMRDPKSKEEYEYSVMGTSTYALCVTFETVAQDDQTRMIMPPFKNGNTFWKHGAERTCTTLEATQLPAILPVPDRIID